MIYNGIEEIWFKINHKRHKETTVIAISNCGRMKRNNGVVEDIPLGQRTNHNGESLHCYIFLLEHFKPQTLEDKLLGRYYVDHRSHSPIGMNINDIRNLRWCTQLENNRFEERRHNISKTMKGGTLSEEHKKKIGAAIKGRKHSSETRHKMSLAKIGNQFNKGRKLSEETKHKLSESHKGRTFSEEARKKMSESHKGVVKKWKVKHYKIIDGKRAWY